MEVGAILFSKNGYEKTTISAIAKNAQVATGTLFYHFENKEHLFRDIALQYLNELHSRILESNRKPAKDTEHSERMHTEAIISFIDENLDLFSQISNRLVSGSEGWDVLSQAMVNEQEARLKEGIAEGLFREDIDVEIAAQGLVGMLFHVLGWWSSHPSRPSREKLIDTLTKIRLSGIYHSNHWVGKE